MRIDSKSTIAGHPALQIRKLMRRGCCSYWDEELVARVLSVNEEQALAVIEELCRLGYARRDPDFAGAPCWTNTVKGNALALASAAPPIRRSTAERILAGFLDRVRAVNADPYYLYKVRRVLLFGSMVTDAERVGDVDLAVDLVHKFSDPDERETLNQARIREAIRAGHRFSNVIQRLSWPRQEVVQFLKGRSRALNLHAIDDPALLQVPARIILEESV